jgi:small-conductance mechanosensitive channel
MLVNLSTDDAFIRSLIGAAILVAFLVAAGVLSLILRMVRRQLNKRSPEGLALQTIRSLKNPLVVFVCLQGIFLSLITLPPLATWTAIISEIWVSIIILQVAHALISFANGIAHWYSRKLADRPGSSFYVTLIPMVRRVSTVLIYGIATMIALDTLGVSISPLLGGLGISGLAVALALQPTLSNLFAGTYVLADRAISVGDYIALQGGPEGYVIQIGWRSTKVRTWLNNLVIVPNSILADTIVTNYQEPEPSMNVLVYCGVSYSANLDDVEKISLEVANELIADSPAAVKGESPWFGYERFADSNIEFWIFLKAKDRVASFTINSELMKRLHSRFSEKGIEINYPVRKIVYSKDTQSSPL